MSWTNIQYVQILHILPKTAKPPWTKEVWVYDYRTNIHHTLKKNPLNLEDLQDFINCYHPANRHKRQATWSESNPEGRWRKFAYDEIIARDKTSLDISWLYRTPSSYAHNFSGFAVLSFASEPGSCPKLSDAKYKRQLPGRFR
jgi:hypothetical protein